MYLRMFAFLFHYILDDYVVWCGEVVWKSVLVSLAVLLVVSLAVSLEKEVTRGDR